MILLFKKYYFVVLLIVYFPHFVYAQLIDNRDLPPEALRIRPPFEPSDRSKVSTRDSKVYIILDNADDISIQEFDDSDTSETTMLGNVRVRFDGSFLRAEKMVITSKDSAVINVGAYGNVEFTMNDTKYLADSINYQPDAERGVMNNVRSVISGGLGGGGDTPWFYRAEKVTIESQTRFVLDKVYLSTSDTRFDHFSLKVNKMWYLQGKVILVVGVEYLTGQATFFWLPAYFQMEGSGNIYTSFGNERRIGYYFINNYTLNTKIGSFDIGFDFYERQGQYFKVNYEAPAVGIIQHFEMDVDLANDIRSVRNGDIFSQWVQPQFNETGDLQRISQFAWHYKIDTTIGADGINLSFNTENLNDPFFLQKYSYRSLFDDSTAIDFNKLASVGSDSWFTYQGDGSPQMESLSSGISLTVGNLSVSSDWELQRITRPEESNQFLNSYYDYELKSLTLPTLSYNFGSFEIAKYSYSTKSKVTVLNSDGSSNSMHISRLKDYEKKLEMRSNRSINREVLLQNNGSYKTNVSTNWEPITIKNIITNEYRWADLTLTAQADVSYSAERTFGTNEGSLTADTNWVTIADINRHQEKGSINFTANLFDDLWNINNGVDFIYKEQWSSFDTDYTNNQRESGMTIDYKLGTTLGPEKVWNSDDWNKVAINFKTTVNYSYPLYSLFRIQEDFIKESQFSWQNSINFEFMQWQRETLIGLEFSADWDFRTRIPTEDQQIKLGEDPDDIYLENRIYDRLTVGAKLQLFWFNIGAESTLDILETETNNDPNALIPILGDNFTNKFVSGYPQLVIEFAPDSKYYYLPKLSYKYNLFEKSRIVTVTNGGVIEPQTIRKDKSYSLQIVWDVRLKNYQIPALYPFIYELTEFGFVFQYYQDFINLRDSYLRLDFVIGLKFTKYLTFRFSSQMLNEKIHLYFGGTFNGQSVLAPGEESKDFWQDLGDGLKIWDQEALKRSSFKLQSLNFELIHDLQTWDMRLIFNLGRRVDNIKQIAFWEPYVGLAFTMKGSDIGNIFPEIEKSFVPPEYQ